MWKLCEKSFLFQLKATAQTMTMPRILGMRSVGNMEFELRKHRTTPWRLQFVHYSNWNSMLSDFISVKPEVK